MIKWGSYAYYGNPQILPTTLGRKEGKYKNYLFQIDNYNTAGKFLLYIHDKNTGKCNMSLRKLDTVKEAEELAERICRYICQ